MMTISISTIYRRYFRYIDPPLVSNTFSGLSLAEKRGPVMFTSVVYIENNGIQIVFFSLTRSSLTGEPILFRQYIDSTMR